MIATSPIRRDERESRAPLTVLLIEDNPGDARLIRELLAEAAPDGVRLERAGRLADGLARLAAAPVDAVLLDLSLPDSAGLDTFARAQAAAPVVPIVVLSGLADETLAVRAVHQGAQDYLVKGQVEGHGLVRALRYAIERARAAEERTRLLARERAARAEAERLAAERAAILGQLADGVVIADPQGRVSFANEVARRLYGAIGSETRADRFLGSHEPLTLDGAPYPPAELPLPRAVFGGETVVDAEWRLRRPDGSEVIVQGSATPVVAEDGAPLGAVLTLRDVTEQRELARLREEFFANASHDLRTPLAAIKAAVGVVLANEPAGFPAPLHRMLSNIDGAASEMARLVDDLLELSRLQARRVPFAPLRCDLRDVARRAARAIEPLAEARGQRVELALPDAPVPALADAPRLERALLNLLGNAQKYGRTGGLIRLSLESRPGEALAAVADDGPGIAPADQGRIFERYYRPAGGEARGAVGSGLGLPIVRALVGLHGGRVWVESAPGAGATFRVALPSLEPAPPGRDGDVAAASAREDGRP